MQLHAYIGTVKIGVRIEKIDVALLLELVLRNKNTALVEFYN